jgi:hypothetical protein
MYYDIFHFWRHKPVEVRQALPVTGLNDRAVHHQYYLADQQ